MTAKKRVTRTYTEKERQDALQRTFEVGPAEASKEFGIPKRTLSFWSFIARKLGGGSSLPETRTSDSVVGTEQSGATDAPKTKEAPDRMAVKESSAVPADASPPAGQEPSAKAAASETDPGSQVARSYTHSERARALEHAAKHGVTAAARQLGMSRFSIYDWQRKAKRAAAGVAKENLITGTEQEPRAERDQRILAEWKAHPGLGPSQIRNQLRRRGFKTSVHTIRVVLEENGYVPPKVRRQSGHDQRYEAVRPNQLWHLDFLHRHIHKLTVYILLLLDDFSRFIVGGALWDGERVAAVIETFEAAVARHGRPERVMTDGGSAFHAWRGVGRFTSLLEELEVDQLIASVPEVNGKLEVLNANIQKELFNQEVFFDLAETQRRLKAWIAFYNLRRTHHALGGLLVPADRYFGRAGEVLAEIEAGRTPQGIGEPLPVAERVLDLFRVASRNGQMEICLLGKRLFVTEDR